MRLYSLSADAQLHTGLGICESTDEKTEHFPLSERQLRETAVAAAMTWCRR